MATKSSSSFAKLREVERMLYEFPGIQYDLPRIVAVGQQSSGKSSVVEAIIRMDILPKGQGMVTRCPIVMRLVPSESEKRVVFYDAACEALSRLDAPRSIAIAGDESHSEVRSAIQARMDALCGEGLGISDTPIVMSIFRPDVVSVTLVDLPGMVIIPTPDQPSDIEEQINRLILKYIKESNSFILTIVSANVDYVNCGSLKLANLVDKDGSRTLGVVTKIDLMDRGTDCRKLLENKLHVLKCGYVGVINRTHEQVAAGASIQAAAEYEEKFFSSEPAYRSLRCGSAYLTEKIYEVFVEMVLGSRNALKRSVEKMAESVDKEVEDLGGSICDCTRETACYKYLKMVKEMWGKGTSSMTRRIHSILSDTAGSVDITGFVHEELKGNTSIIDSGWLLRMAFHKKSAALAQDVRNGVQKFRAVFDERLASVHINGFTALSNELNVISTKIFSEICDDLVKQVDMYMEIKSCMINYEHPDFSACEIISDAFSRSKSSGATESRSSHSSWINSLLKEVRGAKREEKARRVVDQGFEGVLLCDLAERYYDIYKKDVIDLVTKSVFYFYGVVGINKLHNEINKHIRGLGDEFFECDPDIKERIKSLGEQSSKLHTIMRYIAKAS